MCPAIRNNSGAWSNMTVQSAQSVTVLFTTRVFSTGVGTNADSLPTGTLYVNGTANGASVTVTNISTGLYKAAVTLPTLAVNDIVSIEISATVNSVADTGTIWRDTKDVVADASGYVTASSVTGAVGSVTGITSSDVGAIKAKTDNLPASPASTTNISAGTITTVTNLTNAPTNGDLTDAMKASVTAAVPTANANADALLDRAAGVETGMTFRQAMRLISSVLLGKVSGAATATNTFRDVNDSTDRVISTVTADGDRTAVTLDPS